MLGRERRATVFSLLLVAVMASVIIGVAILINRAITRPLLRLKAGTEVIASGDLDHRIETKSEDELGDLSRSFNQMAEKLQDSYQALRDKNVELEGFARTLSHDIRGPLTAMTLATDSLTKLLEKPYDEKSDSEITQLVKVIDKSVQRSTAMADEILSLARADRMPVEVERV